LGSLLVAASIDKVSVTGELRDHFRSVQILDKEY